MESIKSEHLKEIAQIKEQNEKHLNDIKTRYDQEKNCFKTQLSRVHAETVKETHKSNGGDYLNEIRELNNHLNEFKKQSQSEIATIKNQRDEYAKKLAVSQKNSSAMQNSQTIQAQTIKTLKEKLDKTQEQFHLHVECYGYIQKYISQMS